jgi:trans-aconitate methyltransferase
MREELITTQGNRLGAHPDAIAYERDVLPFVRPFATAVVHAAQHALSRVTGGTVLDHGAGTGLVTSLLHVDHPSLHIHALDPNAKFLSYITPTPWLSTQQGVASELKIETSFVGALSNLTLMFCPDPVDDLRTILRFCQPGAPLSLSVLGPAESVQPFHLYWSAFADEISNGWPPEQYVHHRFADPQTLVDAAIEAGWTNPAVTAVHGYRQIEGQQAWEWLRRALPVGAGDGYCQTLDDESVGRAKVRFLKRWAGARFCRSQAWLLTAHRSTTGPNSLAGTRAERLATTT